VVLDVTNEPFVWWLDDAHILVQAIVWLKFCRQAS
jgi:hypothetical protein